METKITYFESLDSTNTKVRELACQGAKEGTVVVAEKQTAGKGRRGRNWESPAGTNIYMSVLLRPQIEANKAPMLTLVMAYSIGRVLKERGYETIQIKWPNDLVLSGKKICGILTEAELNGQEIDHVIVGVGINVNQREFDPSIPNPVSMAQLLDRELDAESVLRCFLKHLQKNYEILRKKPMH